MADENFELKKRLERLRYLYGLENEMIRAAAAFEHAALRPLFILNGGALVVYLGLFGALRRGSGDPAGIDWAVGKYAVWAWLAGILLAAATAFLGALSQFSFRKLRGREVAQAEIDLAMRSESASEVSQSIGRYTTHATCYRIAAIGCGILCIVLFVAGFWPAFLSIA